MDLSNMSYSSSVLEYGPKSSSYENEFLTTELICVTISLQHVNIINLRLPGGS